MRVKAIVNSREGPAVERMKGGKREYVSVVSSQYAVTVRLNLDISKEECIRRRSQALFRKLIEVQVTDQYDIVLPTTARHCE